MDEWSNPPGKQNQRRREFLLIFLFQLASITCCLLSFVFNTSFTEAQEFLSISLQPSSRGDYRADGNLYSFQRVNSSLLAEILRDREPQATDIAYRATEVGYIFQTPIPTVTPIYSEPVALASLDPTSSSTASMYPTPTSTPTSFPILEPTLTSTSSPTHIPITKPTYPPPKPIPYTSIPYETPTNTPTRIPTGLPAATLVSNTPTKTASPTLTASSTPSPTVTSTIHPTYTFTPTDTPTPTSSSTPTISPTASSTATNTTTASPTSTPTTTLTQTPAHTQTGTSTPTNTPSQSPTPTPITPACFIGIPPGILPSDDAYLKANSPTSNFGSLPNIEVRPDRIGNWRGLIRFDLSSIPLGSTVTQATLFLYEKDEKIGQVTDIHRVTTGWNEASVIWSSPWSNLGGDFDNSTIFASFAPSQKNCMVTIDLTALVQEWVNGTPNHGMILLSTGPNHIIRYSSKEETLAAQQPKLFVTFSVP